MPPKIVELGETYDATDKKKAAAYNMAVALGLKKNDNVASLTDLSQKDLTDALKSLYVVSNSPMSSHLQAKLFDETNLRNEFEFGDSTTEKVLQGNIAGKFNSLNDLEKAELANLLAQYANTGNITGIDTGAKVLNKNYENYENYGQAANSLYNLATGQAADDTVTNDQMVKMLNELLKEVGEGSSSSGDYKTKKVDPAFAQYQSATATAGIVNIAAGQILYEYQDDDGQKCYMYASNENVLDDTSSTYAEQVSVYENVLNYLEGEMETESQDANVIMSDEGQVAKITFADGTVVTPEVVTEMDNDAYNQAMVEYEYKKDVYDKEMNDCNAKVKIIQAQDQKLEVRLKQLDTEQKALSTEIEALKSIRDKAIESSFKTFS